MFHCFDNNKFFYKTDLGANRVVLMLTVSVQTEKLQMLILAGYTHNNSRNAPDAHNTNFHLKKLTSLHMHW